ncbi:hypothetical protein Pint_18927 [Pistacia integerrima]|uniref:Uncharacterized protein n=1 Tax=Pistacia integerrima TaxID=434235 RepID=A0ACC0YY14_9ROSI|nr:hypothetical protein Pint_18927 [Pistacia integerrima]
MRFGSCLRLHSISRLSALTSHAVKPHCLRPSATQNHKFISSHVADLCSPDGRHRHTTPPGSCRLAVTTHHSSFSQSSESSPITDLCSPDSRRQTLGFKRYQLFDLEMLALFTDNDMKWSDQKR